MTVAPGYINTRAIYNFYEALKRWESQGLTIQLQQRLEEPLFVSLQTRRSQTEGRIGIFKNVFLGTPLRTRIALNKRHAINWCVLTHNLWVLARKIIAEEKGQLKKAA